jgi:type VI secretion system protein ImpG
VREELLHYYERELAYLRQLGAEFAGKYPKVASRLLLEPSRCEDPHVERLLEAFAFLAARLHLKLDDDYPEFTQSLLEIVLPQAVRPVPSMTVAEFQMDPERGQTTGSVRIPRGSKAFTRPASGVRLEFRTGFDLDLWPITVSSAAWVTPDRIESPFRSPDVSAALRMELAAGHGSSFAALAPKSLRFYLNGEASLTFPLYEMLVGRCVRVLLRDLTPGSRRPPVLLPGSTVKPAGFEQSEALLPYPRRCFDGYRLLQEYFAFPEKFLFIDLTGLDALANFGERVEIVMLCRDSGRSDWEPFLQNGVSPKALRLNTTTLVNLFPHTADPVPVDDARFEYPIVPDARRPDSYEIYSIEEIVGTTPDSADTVRLEPFYSIKHSSTGRQGEVFWHAMRRTPRLSLDESTEVWVTVCDLAARPQRPPVATLTVRCLCTNRELPSRMMVGDENGDFELESAAPVSRVVALRKPTPTVRPPIGGEALWRLISHLSLNYLSLTEEGSDALREILRLYAGSPGGGERQIEGIKNVTSRRHFARVIGDYGISFVRGMQVRVDLDEEFFVGSGAYLFGAVLDRFLGLYVNLNGFSQLEVWSRQRKEALGRWPARSGYGILL